MTYQLFKSLGDPQRLHIISLLKNAELSASEILDELDIGQSTVSHHMKVLTDVGAVISTPHGKWITLVPVTVNKL